MDLAYPPTVPAYPTTGDLSAAAWLKQFANLLPAYAAKYQIAEAEAMALQGASHNLLTGLGEQVARVTLAIRLLAASPHNWPPSAVPRQPDMRTILPQATALSYRILSHDAYDPADGSVLGLECHLN
ncbi:MAG: hypothetical protein ACRYF0_08985 [Janthinobacterium lividum]